MKHTIIEKKYKQAMDKLTPDVYSRILETCQDGLQTPIGGNLLQHRKRKPHFYRRPGYLGAAAAAFLLVSGISGGHYYLGGSTVIALDVNPSVSLEINRMNRVVKAQALNEDGTIILEEMKPEGTDIDTAISALIDAMLKEGYLNEAENSVLLSVISEDKGSRRELQANLTRRIQQAFDNTSVEGAVISQNLAGHEAQYQELAEEYHISEGKAALAYKIASQTSTMNASDVAALSVNDINLLAHSQGFELGEAQTQGTASAKRYIGEEKAVELTFDFCGLEPEDVHHLQTSMDYNNGKVTYEVEFYKDEYKYEYELDATDGDLLEWETEWKRADLLAAELEELDRENKIQGISDEEVLSIAAKHAGIDPGDIIFYKISPDYELEEECFEVEFVTAENEYEYKIDAATGKIIEYTYIASAYE